jgi:hypothetical protein
VTGVNWIFHHSDGHALGGESPTQRMRERGELSPLGRAKQIEDFLKCGRIDWFFRQHRTDEESVYVRAAIANRSACSGRGSEIDAPEVRTGLKKFQRGDPPVGVNADDAALQVSLCLQIRQQDSLFRNHPNIETHQSAFHAHVEGFGNF